MRTNRVGSSVVSAMTHTPASGPLGPVTTPPMSSASTATVAAGACCRALTAPIVSAQTAATRTACIIRVVFIVPLWFEKGAWHLKKVAGTFVGKCQPPYSRGLTTIANQRNSLRRKSTEHRADDEPYVGGALRQATHIPREPIFAVADEDTQAAPFARKASLLPSLNAVQHRKLV